MSCETENGYSSDLTPLFYWPPEVSDKAYFNKEDGSVVIDQSLSERQRFPSITEAIEFVARDLNSAEFFANQQFVQQVVWARLIAASSEFQQSLERVPASGKFMKRTCFGKREEGLWTEPKLANPSVLGRTEIKQLLQQTVTDWEQAGLILEQDKQIDRKLNVYALGIAKAVGWHDGSLSYLYPLIRNTHFSLAYYEIIRKVLFENLKLEEKTPLLRPLLVEQALSTWIMARTAYLIELSKMSYYSEPLQKYFVEDGFTSILLAFLRQMRIEPFLTHFESALFFIAMPSDTALENLQGYLLADRETSSLYHRLCKQNTK